MYKYKIVLNGQGGYFFCALLNVSIIDFWIKNKSIELLQEYILISQVVIIMSKKVRAMLSKKFLKFFAISSFSLISFNQIHFNYSYASSFDECNKLEDAQEFRDCMNKVNSNNIISNTVWKDTYNKLKEIKNGDD